MCSVAVLAANKLLCAVLNALLLLLTRHLTLLLRYTTAPPF